MKKITLLLVAIVLTAGISSAQKVCHVDSEYILEKIPAYVDAQAEIEEIALEWQAEIEAMYQQVDSLYKIYQKEEVLLTEELQIKKQDEIIAKEAEAKQLQQKYFGVEGEMYEKRQELIKPIQDNVYNALVELAEEGGYDYVFDVVSGEILYAAEDKDESDSVLEKLGY